MARGNNYFALVGLILLLLTGCMAGPDYQRPEFKTPGEFKYADGSVLSERIERLPDGAWWRRFKDPELNQLIKKAEEANPDLESALARLEQSLALTRSARSGLFPDINLGADIERARLSGNAMQSGFGSSDGESQNNFIGLIDLTYEIDLWGRIRRQVESVRAQAEARAAAWRDTLLILRADVAESYFQIRTFDDEIDLLERTLKLRIEALKLVTNQFDAGFASDLAVARAETEVNVTRSDLIDVRRQRALAANALASLLGTTPAEFSFSVEEDYTGRLPKLPKTLPSELLLRRPDIAEAERLMASASAEIGAAVAEFFPRVNLLGDGGFQSFEIDDWFESASFFGSIGPSVRLPLITGGRIKANVDAARAEFRELTSLYERQVLDAFREVEDRLADAQFLRRRGEALDAAVASATRATDLSQTRYKEGLVTYLEVTESQRTQLEVERQEVRNQGRQLINRVLLIEALGGGW